MVVELFTSHFSFKNVTWDGFSDMGKHTLYAREDGHWSVSPSVAQALSSRFIKAGFQVSEKARCVYPDAPAPIGVLSVLSMTDKSGRAINRHRVVFELSQDDVGVLVKFMNHLAQKPANLVP